LIISTTAIAPTISNFAYTVTNNGTSVIDHVLFIPTLADTGYHVVTFTAQDNGADSLITTISIVLHIIYTADPPPVITGDTIACPDIGVVLTAGPGYTDYTWYPNNFNGPSILVGAGEYLCIATSGDCHLASNTITVTAVPNPVPVINGVVASCGGQPAVLSTTLPYEAYQWSNSSTGSTTTVGVGTYTVMVTDTNGCQAISPPVNVVSVNDPVALFTSDSPSTIFPGTTVVFTNESTVQGGTISSLAWSVNGTALGNGQTLAQLFDTPGVYQVTLTVTTNDGCTSTYTYTQTVIPTDVIVPNVFSPNSDGNNDALTFSGVEYYPNSSLKVFNRWGQEVFASSSYRNTWRPTDVPEGTYYYILKVSNGKEYAGHVTLLR
jgi:gliding motility-associated-like protein